RGAPEATGDAAGDNSAKRGAPAGADAPRHREQDAMGSERPSQSGPGEGTQAVIPGPDTRAAGPYEGTAGAGSAGQLTFAQAGAGQGTAVAAAAPVDAPAGPPADGAATAPLPPRGGQRPRPTP